MLLVVVAYLFISKSGFSLFRSIIFSMRMRANEKISATSPDVSKNTHGVPLATAWEMLSAVRKPPATTRTTIGILLFRSMLSPISAMAFSKLALNGTSSPKALDAVSTRRKWLWFGSRSAVFGPLPLSAFVRSYSTMCVLPLSFSDYKQICLSILKSLVSKS